MPWKSQIDFCASGKWSVKNPPPFCLEKKPLKPHRLSFIGPTSSRSTTSRSPGSAPLTPIGPDKKCTIDRSISRTSSAESLFLMKTAVPAIVDHIVFVGRLREIDLDQRLWHQKLPCLQVLVTI